MSKFDKEPSKKSESKRYLEFYLGKESYAVELLRVKEVITPPDTTPIPKSPAHVCGLINLHGLVLTVVDLRKKLGVVPDKEETQNAVIILDLEERLVGVVVDSIQKVLNITEDQVRPVPDTEGQTNGHLLGIFQHENKLTMWIDPKTLLEGTSTAALKAA